MKSSLITKLLAAAPVVFMATAMAGVTPNLLDSQGNAVRDGSGACVQELNSVDHPDCVAKKVEPPKPLPAVEPPKPRSVVKRVERPVLVPPILTAPADAPSPVSTPTPPSAPVEVASAGTSDSLQVTQPNFSADYLENPAPPFPSASRRAGEQGRVLLRVLVNVRGTADEVQVRTSSGHARLDESARDTVRRWRFVPARRGAEPTAAWVLIPISFRLEG